MLAAIIVPRDVPERLRSAINLSGGEPPQIEVIYSAGDPLKANYVKSLIESKVADANRVLQQRVTEISAGYLDILLNGGSFSVLGDDFEVLGLKRSKQVDRHCARRAAAGFAAARAAAPTSRSSPAWRSTTSTSPTRCSPRSPSRSGSSARCSTAATRRSRRSPSASRRSSR